MTATDDGHEEGRRADGEARLRRGLERIAVSLDWAWIERNLSMIGSLLVEHIILALLPVLIAFVISLPLGYLVSKTRRVANVLLAFLGLIYSVPSLALFVLMPLLLGTQDPQSGQYRRGAGDLFDCAAGPQRRGRTALGAGAGESSRLQPSAMAGCAGCSGLSCRSPCR